MLCRKFGVDVKNFAIDRIPEELAGKSPEGNPCGAFQDPFCDERDRLPCVEVIYRRRADRSKIRKDEV